MAELKTRPELLRKVEVEVPGGRTLSGYDLNDVVRQILWDETAENQWPSTTEAARYLGLRVQTLSTLFDESAEDPSLEKGPGLNLRSFSQILAARTRGNPVQFFQKHSLFRSRAAQSLDVDHFSYDGLCSLLTPTQAQSLTRIIEALLDQPEPNALDDFLAGTRRLLRISEETKPRAAKNKKTG